MVCGIDLLSLLNWSVVKPENDVAVVAIILEVWTSNRYRLVGIVREDSKRAGGVETHTTDGIRVNVVLAEDSLNARADAPPDICS